MVQKCPLFVNVLKEENIKKRQNLVNEVCERPQKVVKLKSEQKIKTKMLAPLTNEVEKSWIVHNNITILKNFYWTKWSSYLSLDRNKMNDTKYGYLFSVAKFSNSFEIICQSSRCAASFGNHLSPTTTSILATKDRKLYHFVHRGQGTYGKSVVCNNTRVSNICY